ncbi:Pantothenate kinase 2 [Babesia sp. Xinjiang]|uniref:Pantothenate kinase 2 n=1 Tax=Babesia sp. Xinjiang TaxID=462227 RepID=UPI000A2238EF|nr:Pantothenate kinase 2 [Babesia sp. Xinjiang]ORM41388.1 Pantothenate kinase 2 [Babesia sp. Xinjiang]
MISEIVHELQKRQRDFISLLNHITTDEPHLQELGDSALKVAHSLDFLSENILPYLESGYRKTTVGCRIWSVPVEPSVVVSDGLLELLGSVVSTCEELKSIFIKRFLGVDDVTVHHLDDSAFTFKGTSTCPTIFNERDAQTGSVKHLSLDIGGTLVKTAYLSSSKNCGALYNLYLAHHAICDILQCLERNGEVDLLSRCKVARYIRKLSPAMIRLDGCSIIKFLRFPVEPLSVGLKMLRDEQIVTCGDIISATGGGAHKYANVFEERLSQCEFSRFDEMPCVVEGTETMHGITRCFIRYNLKHGYTELATVEKSYPYLIVNIGSGISFLKVTSPGVFQRVTGTSVGGGTMSGLISMFLGSHSGDELTMLYDAGTNCMDSFLPEWSRTAPISYGIKASFGACDRKFRREDAIRSTSDMISYSIGQVAFLVARLHQVKRIIFTGSYTADYRMTVDVIASSIAYMASSYAEEPVDTLVPVFGGYVGVLGCLVQQLNGTKS